MTEKTNEIITTRYVKRGDLNFISLHVFKRDGYVIMGVDSPGAYVSANVHMTREEALTISRDLADIVAAYDATTDHYHDQCDEPEYTAQEHEDNKGCYQCHQRREG